MDIKEIRMLPVDQTHLFDGNPFAIRRDEEMEMLCESVREYGIYMPILVRPDDSGMYEVISGQRRLLAAVQAGLTEIPAIVREMSRSEAVIALVDSNIHREHILPSERAKAYQMKMEAIRHQGKRVDLTCGQDDHKLTGGKSRDTIAVSAPDSARQIQRYLRLNSLEKPLLDMVDDGKIGLTIAVQLSYLSEKEQNLLADVIGETDATPNLSQAMRMRQLSETEGLSLIRTKLIMNENKANQREYLKLPLSEIRHYFPSSYTDREIGEAIIKTLEASNKRRKEPQL